MSVAISLTARGGGDEIGASCYDYYFNNELVRVDCGMRPGNFNSDIRPVIIRDKELSNFLDDLLVKPKVNPLPNLHTPVELKHLILTHGHLDHVGVVPYLLRSHRNVTIYATPVTADFCSLQWFSTPRIAEKNGEVPLFNEDDASFALTRIREILPKQRIRINDDLEFEPIEAGHLLGAVSIIFYWQGKPIGFHSGDITLHNNQRSVPDAPDVRFDRLRFLTIEATRVTEHNPPRHIEEERLKETLSEAYLKKIKTRILSFAIGRSPEMFALAKEACPDAEIWIDGLAREASLPYAKYVGGVFAEISKHFVNDKSQRQAIIHSTRPNIVLCPSAMQFGGYSRRYIEHGCGQPDHLFISPGYRDPHSPEYAFFASNSHNDVFAFGAHKAARLCKTATFNFTSHCDGDDVLEMRSRVNPDTTVLVHGDREKVSEFIRSLPEESFIIAKNEMTLEL